MEAVGKCLIIQKKEEGITKTKGGVMLSANQREDIRYIEANVISVGEEVVGIKKNDNIFYDRNAGHKIEIDKETYFVIRIVDVVVRL
jgi:co-chaperonin GroES (HSP10)